MANRWLAPTAETHLGQRDDSFPGGAEKEDVRLYLATCNSTQFKIYELLTSEILHLMFLDHGQLKPQKAKPWIRSGVATVFHLSVICYRF